MIIVGRVISGTDTTPKGFSDVPRRLVFEVETEDKSVINLTYTAFPPSPIGEQQMKKIRLAFHEGRVLPGHYVKAGGTYRTETNTLTVGKDGDFIETSSERP